MKVFVVFFLCFHLLDVEAQIAKTIVVDQSGGGDFSTVQQAIDSVPSQSQSWTRIQVHAGIYNEKVEIPRDKQRIVLEGDSSRRGTVIQFSDAGDTITSSTFKLFAENFVARNIVFKNTYTQILINDGSVDQQRIVWAPAALVNADKAAFYGCSFIGLQDTLTDSLGRHYFESCFIAGAIDFIWGKGQSIYQGCVLNVTAGVLGGPQIGYITAQGRSESLEQSGFVFKRAQIVGTGRAYLGRPHGGFSRVLFYRSTMSDIIVPEGWSIWDKQGQEQSISFSEVNCTGAGSGLTKRVPWEKQLTAQELKSLVKIKRFINQDGWLDNLPS